MTQNNQLLKFLILRRLIAYLFVLKYLQKIIEYTSETTYDALSRTTSIKYPDNETVNYNYDTGGNLYQVTGYVTSYSNYNALGQVGTITYANGVSTIYQYYTSNNRLYSITTNSPSAGGLQNISYGYDNIGSITGITDYLDSTRSQTFNGNTKSKFHYKPAQMKNRHVRGK